MDKKIKLSYKGQNEHVGFISVVRSLPNRFVDSIGHFVFLDQMPLKELPSSEIKKEIEGIKGKSAHPHRGIATFSYVMKGTIEHNDSAGNYGIVNDGGIQWMKAANGIIHDEIIIPSEEEKTAQFGMQFWINLPADKKAESPEWMAIQSEGVPEIMLADNKGKIRLLIGEMDGKNSKIPTYSKLFLYHLILNPNTSHTISINEEDESALVVANGLATVNNTELDTSEMIVFDTQGSEITIENKTEHPSEILIFGGEPYTEEIVFGGPFVMNTSEEIIQANRDYRAGKYGTISYRS